MANKVQRKIKLAQKEKKLKKVQIINAIVLGIACVLLALLMFISVLPRI